MDLFSSKFCETLIISHDRAPYEPECSVFELKSTGTRKDFSNRKRWLRRGELIEIFCLWFKTCRILNTVKNTGKRTAALGCGSPQHSMCYESRAPRVRVEKIWNYSCISKPNTPQNRRIAYNLKSIRDQDFDRTYFSKQGNRTCSKYCF